MTFKSNGLLRNEIVSDEGFTVVTGKDSLLYTEGERQMHVTTEAEPSGLAVALDTIGRWDDNPSRTVSDDDKQRIANNIRRALEWRGYTVSMF